MKATARKIKDNEWIAEVEDWGQDNRNYYGTNQHPIVSPSDKAWLEKNNMDGKEVEGSMRHSESGLEAIGEHGFYLNLPIHSDPAGEEKRIIKKLINWEKSFPDDPIFQNHPLHDIMKMVKSLKSTPQTGRTYTEGEIQAIKNESYNSGYNKGYQARGDKNRLFPQ